MYHNVINFGYKMMSLLIVRLTFSAIAQGQFTCCLKINIFSLCNLTKQQLNIVSSILGVLFVIPLNQPYSNWYNSLEGFFYVYDGVFCWYMDSDLDTNIIFFVNPLVSATKHALHPHIEVSDSVKFALITALFFSAGDEADSPGGAG